MAEEKTDSPAMTFDPSKVKLTDIDPVSSVPYLHQSFVLHSFVPIRYVRRQKPFDEPNFIGMYPEGYKIPTILTKDAKGNVIKKTAFDDAVVCMMVGQEKAGPDNDTNTDIDCITNCQVTRPGYLCLHPKGPTRQAKSAPAITRERTRTMLSAEVSSRGTSSRTYLRKQNELQEEAEKMEENEPLTPRTLSRTGTPSAKTKRKKLPDNVEYALALKHQKWPEVADEWGSRGRNFGWPGKRIEKKILAGGCHVTPGSHPNSTDPEIEWEYTFYEAERVLDKEAVSSVQRQCFMLLCMLCMESLGNKMISLRQLKSVFYFCCETTDPQIWRTNKAVCVNKLIDSLLDGVRNGNLPDYFIPKNNTISHLQRDELVALEKSFSAVRNNPIQCLLEMTKSCALVNIFPFYCNVAELFNPFVENAKSFAKSEDKDKAARALLTVTDELCNSFYLDAGFEIYEESFEEITVYIQSLIAHGVSGFEEAVEYFIKPLQGDGEAQKHLEFLPQLLSQKNISLSEKLPPTEIWRPIRLCRLLIQKFANSNQGSHLFDHLGCMYHSASSVFKEHRQESLQKADAAFKEALGKEDCGIGTYVDYGRFLCRTKRYDECLPVLRKVILKEAKKPDSKNFYGKMEALVADEFIKREIEAEDGLEVFSCMYALYLTCECYIKLKKKPELVKSLSQFEELCKLTNDPSSISLMGYTLMKLRRFNKASDWFKLVQKAQPANKVVIGNIAACKKYESQNVADDDLNLEKEFQKLKFW
ncbi:hypothetical protein ACF0H5_017969 [Mactra antiquata]